eukprot:11058473-Alexandrium_andersonii.AAC.1
MTRDSVASTLCVVAGVCTRSLSEATWAAKKGGPARGGVEAGGQLEVACPSFGPRRSDGQMEREAARGLT